MRIKCNGQALIEILISLAVITIVMVAVVSRATEAVKNEQYARNKVLAARFAQEGVEWSRAQRDQMGWKDFSYRIRSDAYAITAIPGVMDTDTKYCVLDVSESLTCLPSSCVSISKLDPSDSSIEKCSNYISGTVFQRSVYFNYIFIAGQNAYVNVEVLVEWEDGSGLHNAKYSTRLSQWRV